MSYLDENGLARYDGLLKNWVTFKSGTVDGIDPLLNWQRTSTAGAVTFYPLPAAPLDPVVNFLFTESGPVSGTKSPDNPSTITGVTQAKVTRCGKNLITFPYYSQTGTDSHNVTWTVNADGSVTASGTADGISQFHLVKPYWENGGGRLLQVGSYKLSGCASGGGGNTYKVRVLSFSADAGYISAPGDTGSGSTVSITKPIIVSYCIEINNGVTVSNLVFKPQLELGTTATAFEPYEGADYTIDLGGTYYGGSVDLSAGTMTVTYAMVPMQSSDEYFWSGDVHCIGRPLLGTNLPKGRALGTERSTHFVFGDVWSGSSAHFYVGVDRVYFFDPSWDSKQDALDYIAAQEQAGTPVKIVYEIANPITVPLTPTQIYSLSQPDPYTPRINTVYSDQVSVQVGYPKSPLATSAELTNAIIELNSI